MTRLKNFFRIWRENKENVRHRKLFRQRRTGAQLSFEKKIKIQLRLSRF